MMRVKTLRLACAIVGLTAATSFGAGFESSVVGSSAGSMAGSFRGIADDWSAAYYNPAGLSWIKDNQFGLSWNFLHYRDEVTARHGFIDPVSSQRYDMGVYNDRQIYNRHEIQPNGSFGLITRLPIWGETSFGLSIYEPFDYSISWNLFSPLPTYNDTLPDRNPDRQYLTDLDVIAFQATFSKEIQPDKLSLGIGLQLFQAELIYHDLVFRKNPLTGDAAARPRDYIPELPRNEGDGYGFGFNVGMMYKASPKLSVGATISMPFELTLKGRTILNFILPKYVIQNTTPLGSVEDYFTSGGRDSIRADFETKLKLPPSFGIGIGYAVSERLTASLDLNYTLWSTFEGFSFEYSNFSLLPSVNDSVPGFFTANLAHPVEWDDAGRVALGLRYKFSSLLTAMAGANLEQSVNSSGTSVTPNFIDTGDKLQLAGGLRFTINEWDITSSIRYTKFPDQNAGSFVDLNGDGTIDTFPGDFKAKAIEPQIALTYRF